MLQVTYGDFGESPLEQLSAVSSEVILPLLSNPANQGGWPDVVAKEITDNLHKFVAHGARWGRHGHVQLTSSVGTSHFVSGSRVWRP